MGCYFLLQGIFLTQGSNQDLLHCRQILCRLSYKEKPVTVNPANSKDDDFKHGLGHAA